VRAVAQGRGGFPGRVRQCSGKQRRASIRPFRRTSNDEGSTRCAKRHRHSPREPATIHSQDPNGLHDESPRIGDRIRYRLWHTLAPGQDLLGYHAYTLESTVAAVVAISGARDLT
jgi:hypothetical protein